MKRIILFLFSFVLFSLVLKGQSRSVGSVKIKEEASIAEAVVVNGENFEGYRIQVFSGNSQERENALKIKEDIENTYNVRAYIDYEPPMFKVRVGDFIERLEAVPLKYKLREDYPQCYIVKLKEVKLFEHNDNSDIGSED